MYKILKESDVVKYVNSLGINDFSGEICTEIGDGNLNHVFRVESRKSDSSIIVKQALPYARTSVEMALDAGRCRIEATALIEQKKYTSYVPNVYHYDNDLCLMVMEDLKNYKILRTLMMEQKEVPHLAEQAASYFAHTLIRTSDVVLDSKIKKDMQVSFINKDLCDLTEKLVLTTPTYRDPRGRVYESIKEYVDKNLWQNKLMKKEYALLKHKFMTSAQSLLHGDAHSGSVFVNNTDIKFIDAEFAFFGPAGFDIGMFIANLIMDSVYQKYNGFDSYHMWVTEQIRNFVDSFILEFHAVYDRYATEKLAKESAEFKQIYLENILTDAAGYCACEIMRRTVGSSHVPEVDNYSDPELQKKALIENLKTADTILFEKSNFQSGSMYYNLLI